MALQGIPTDEERERIIEESRQAFLSRMERHRERKNVELSLSLDLDRVDILTFHGVTYDVPTLPYQVGFELSTLWAELSDISRAANKRVEEAEKFIARGETPPPVYTAEQYAEMLAKLRRAVVLFWDSVRVPEVKRGAFARMFWRVRLAWGMAKRPEEYANPFMTASEAEVAELFRFFSDCRTRSSVRRHQTTTTGSYDR